jgi:hypothetical protein
MVLQDFVGLVSEYIHGVAHDETEAPHVRGLAGKTWVSLKRSAKAGPRRTVGGGYAGVLATLGSIAARAHAHSVDPVSFGPC